MGETNRNEEKGVPRTVPHGQVAVRQCTLAAICGADQLAYNQLFMQRRCAFLALGLLSLSLPAAAQRTGVTVTGTVVDQTGGVLPSAQVELLTDSGTVQTTTTNQNGEFQLTGVPSGRYNLAATLEGFQPTTPRVTR